MPKNLRPLDMTSSKITSVADPTSAQDVATKNYVDTRKSSFNVGNNSASTFNLVHNFGTADVGVTLYEISSGVQWYPDVSARTTNQVTVQFSFVPTTNQFRAVIV